jgi:cytochrome P450
MLFIISTPRVYHRLQAEIDFAVSNGKISRPVVTDEEARALPYLQAVIREGLRIFPPGTGLASKLVPPEGDTFNGMFLPGGTKIGISTWALLRNEEAFGKDSASFRPERWLDISVEDFAKMERFQEFVWGYGKYVCLGRRVALIELNKSLVEVSYTRRDALLAGLRG